MSYDITLLRREPGQSWDDALQALEATAGDDTALTARELEQWQRIERRVREVLGEVEADADESGAELSHHPTGLQVALYGTSGSVSYPYWDQDDPAAFHRQVAEVVRIVTEETGLEAYDPQVDAPFGVPHDQEGLEHTRQLAGEVRASALVDGGPEARYGAAGATPSREPDRTPAVGPATRGRALRFLVVGVLIVAVSLFRVGSGEPSWLTWALLVLGAAELVYGAVLLRRAR